MPILIKSKPDQKKPIWWPLYCSCFSKKQKAMLQLTNRNLYRAVLVEWAVTGQAWRQNNLIFLRDGISSRAFSTGAVSTGELTLILLLSYELCSWHQVKFTHLVQRNIKKSLHRCKHIFRHAYCKQFCEVLIRFPGHGTNIIRTEFWVGAELNQNKQKL